MGLALSLVLSMALGLVMAAPGLGWAAEPPGQSHGQSHGQPLVVMLDSEPATLNPFLATDAYGTRISHQLIHQSLVGVDERLEVVPVLAEKWERPRPERLVFTLRQGVRFHDGSPLKAGDVKATLEAFMDTATGSPYGAVLREKVVRVTAPDDRRVVVELKAAYSDILSDLMVPVVSAATLNKGGPAALSDQSLNGTGPFRLAGRSPGELVLERFEGYHGAPAGIARVVFKVVKDDNTRLLKLRKGDIDLAINVIPLEKLALFSRSPLKEKYRVQELPGLSFQYLGFNLEHPVLKNRKVRQAIAHAVDMQSL
ncbi:MAG: ABC transporter substrate-binding protein, partial [Deltaproteobacteria bacterium]|nr:ABC transporter substrate-binding protein [Deltaproteobacteria bacterium]